MGYTTFLTIYSSVSPPSLSHRARLGPDADGSGLPHSSPCFRSRDSTSSSPDQVSACWLSVAGCDRDANLSRSATAGTQFNPGAFLEDTSPYSWALTGVALNIGLSVIGAGWYVTIHERRGECGTFGCDAAGMRERASGRGSAAERSMQLAIAAVPTLDAVMPPFGVHTTLVLHSLQSRLRDVRPPSLTGSLDARVARKRLRARRRSQSHHPRQSSRADSTRPLRAGESG